MSNILLLLQRVHQNVHQNRHSLDKKKFSVPKIYKGTFKGSCEKSDSGYSVSINDVKDFTV